MSSPFAANWIYETTNTIGPGDIILTGSKDAQSTFNGAVDAGRVWYSILDGKNREAGYGTYDGVNTLQRTEIHATLLDGLYTDILPEPIPLTGIGIVECTFNSKAYRDLLLSGATQWGTIEGLLSDQTDLQDALNTKADQSDLDITNSNVATNTTNISTNTINIASNRTDIDTNTLDINDQANDIAVNKADISTNTGNISTNTSDILLNRADIDTNTGQIATNVIDIDQNTNDIAANRIDIDTNTDDIATNLLLVNSKEPRLGNPIDDGYILSSTTGGIRSWVFVPGLGGDVEWGNITGLLSDQTDLQYELDRKADQTDLDTTNANVTQNEDDISDNADDIFANTTNISNNAIAIQNNETAIDNKEDYLGLPSTNDGEVMTSTQLGVRSWHSFGDLDLGIIWGDIGGTLSDQTDLQTALDNKSDITHNHDGVYLKEVKDDLSPQLGGSLETLEHHILITDNSTVAATGMIGDIEHPQIGHGSFFIYSRDGIDYNEEEGGIRIQPSKVVVQGSTIGFNALAGEIGAGNRNIKCNEEGVLYTEQPPTPVWSESTTDNGDYVTSNAAWVEVTGLLTQTPQIILAGDRLNVTVQLHIELGLLDEGGTLNIAVTETGAAPVGATDGVAIRINPGFDGVIPISKSIDATSDIAVNTPIQVWTRITAEDSTAFDPVLVGTGGGQHRLELTAPAEGELTDWGEIGGTLSDQTDLQSELDAKEDILGNPTNNNLFLSSLEDGTRQWQLPVAQHSSGTDYVVNDIVNQNGQLYTCAITHTAKAFDFADWESSVSQIGFGTQMNYVWSSATSGNPSIGQVYINDALPTIATEITFSEKSSGNTDVKFIWLAANEGDILGFEESVGDQESVYYEVTGSPTDNITSVTIPVTYIGGSGIPEDGKAGIASYTVAPANKLPVGGNTSDVLVKSSTDNYDTEWQAPKWAVWKGAWVNAFYNFNEWVTDGPWGAIVNNPAGTNDRAGPQPTGDPLDVYTGTMVNAQISAKQVLFGNRYLFTSDGYLNSYRINTIAGNHYNVVLVMDPLGAPVAQQLLSFDATDTGWVTKSISQTIIQENTAFDLLIQVNEPDPAPAVWSGTWAYTTPNNFIAPSNGEIVHNSKDTAHISINYIDGSAGDRTAELQALTVGDTFDANGTSWSIQTIDTANGSYIKFGVTPATQTVQGTYSFVFETVTATPISYGKDLDYWLTSPHTVQGLYIADGDYDNIVPDNSAYGVDITVQEALISDDWDIVSNSEGGTGGGDSGPAIEIVDNLTTQDATKALSANQGYVLDQAKAEQSDLNITNTAVSDNATAITTKEDDLGNPIEDGYVLSSLIDGTRSWTASATGGDRNPDGGSANMNYLPEQSVDGGGA